MANFSSEWLIGKKQFRYLTGVEPQHFKDMTAKLELQWNRRSAAKNRSGRPYGVGELAEHLLVLLLLYRTHLGQEFLACLYGVDKSCICRSLARIEPLARKALGVKKRIVLSAEQAQAVIMDCTEQRTERPTAKQKCYYSGKKKCHTIKNEIMATEAGEIVYASGDAPGSVHDIALRRRGPPVPHGAQAYADSGYQGYQEDHPDIEIPYKKPKKGKLDKEEKEYNTALSRFRVRVEHAIRRMKTFRILADRFRYPRRSHAAKFSIIAGIANITAGF